MIPDPLRPPVPQDRGFATPPKTPVAVISGTAKVTDFKFGPLNQITHVGVSQCTYLNLFGGEIIFEVFQPICDHGT